MHWVGSGIEQQWHCFWPVDGLDCEKPLVFVEVYRQLNMLMSDNRGVLNPIIAHNEWDKVEFPMKVGDVDRRFAYACGMARTFLQPKYVSMPAHMCTCMYTCQPDAGRIYIYTPNLEQ